MSDRHDLMSELDRHVEELVEPRQHTELIWDVDQHRNRRVRRAYVTRQDGLMAQLRAVAHEGLRLRQEGRGGPSGKPGSRPPGCFDALNRHVYITAEAYSWATGLGVRRPTVDQTILAFVGVAPLMTDVDLARLVRELRYWRGSAAVATGWVERPYTPPVPCPTCSRFGSLRVNIETRGAYCTNPDRTPTGELACGGAWPPGTAGQLFAYIKAHLEAVPA
jgi:hypothetical protein